MMMLVPIRIRSPSASLVLGDLLAVDEASVRGAEVFEKDVAVFDGDLRVSARDHVFDEHHVELARAPDDDLSGVWKRKLPSLILPRDETQRQRQRQILDDQFPSLGTHSSQTEPPNLS